MSDSLLKLKTSNGARINFEPVMLYEHDSLKEFFKDYLVRVEKPISSLYDRLCSKEDLESKVAISLYLDKLMNDYIYSLPLRDKTIDNFKETHYKNLLSFVSANKEKFQLHEKSNSDIVTDKQGNNDKLTKNTEVIKDIFYQLKKNTIKSDIHKKTKGFKNYPFKKLQEKAIKYVIEEFSKFIKIRQEKTYLDDFFEPQVPDFVLAVIFYDFYHFKKIFTLPNDFNTRNEQFKQKDFIDFIVQCLKELYINRISKTTNYNIAEYNIFEIAENPEKKFFECSYSISKLLQKIEQLFEFKSLNLLLVSDFIKEVVNKYTIYKINVLKTSSFLNKEIFGQCLEILIFNFVLSYTNKNEEINIKNDSIFREMLSLLVKHHNLFSLNEDVFNREKIKETFERLNFNYPKKTFKFKDNINLVFSKELDDFETDSEAYSDNFVRSYFAKSVIEYLSDIFKLNYDEAKLLLPNNEDTNNYMKRLSSYELLSSLQNPNTSSLELKQILELIEKSNTKFFYKFFITPEFQMLGANFLEYHNNISLALSNEVLAIMSNKTVYLIKFKLDDSLETTTLIEIKLEGIQSFNEKYFGKGDAYNSELLFFNI